MQKGASRRTEKQKNKEKKEGKKKKERKKAKEEREKKEEQKREEAEGRRGRTRGSRSRKVRPQSSSCTWPEMCLSCCIKPPTGQ